MIEHNAGASASSLNKSQSQRTGRKSTLNLKTMLKTAGLMALAPGACAAASGQFADSLVVGGNAGALQSRGLLGAAAADALFTPRVDAAPKAARQLVIAHWHDDLGWVERVPTQWDVVVYSAAEEPLPSWETRPITVHKFDGSSESHVIAHHLADSYNALPEYLAFAHDNPFEHSPNIVELLSSNMTFADVQTLSLRRDEHLPTAGVLQQFTRPERLRSERMSLRTGASLYYHDFESAKSRQYRDHYDLHEGTNLVADYLTSVGLPGWVPESQDAGSYAHGSMFGVSRDKVLQHPQSVYTMMALKDEQSEVNGPIAEKSWLMLFGGARFNDHPLPAASEVSASR